tara:strand:- start:3619 stop:4692 length:1074 start_codon:yes stop_codon:yes gene_type:complete
MSFFMGLAEGIATGASRTINTVLDKRQEEASAARKFMMQRRIQEADRYNADMKEAQEQFDAFVGLVGEENMDKAAQIMKGAGSSEQRQELLNYLTAEKRKNEDFDILAAYEFSEMEAGKFGRDDYLRTMVRDPAKLAMPASKKVGLGMADKLFGKQPDMSEGLLPTLRGQKIEGFAGAVAKPGVFSEAKEFKRQEDAAEVALKNAILTNEKLSAEIANMGKMDGRDFSNAFDDVLKSAMTAKGHSFDATTGRFTLKDAEDAYDTAYIAHTDTLESTVKRAVETGAITRPDVRNAMFTAANQVGSYLTEAGGSKYAPKPFNPDTGNDEIGVIYRADWNSDGTIGDALYLGNDKFILLN